MVSTNKKDYFYDWKEEGGKRDKQQQQKKLEIALNDSI